MKFNLKLTCIAAVLFASCAKKDIVVVGQQPTPSLEPITENDPLYLGNPTNAQTNVLLSDNYLLDEKYYKVAYSSSRSIPVWVGWHLQSDDFPGTASRQDDFRGNPKLPSNWYRVETGNYSSSGFDRGHNLPSADRTASVAANSSTFFMTNMIPQAPNLNQGPWEGLEDYVRNTLVGSANEAYIFTGNYGVGGVGSNATVTNTIDNGNITVPRKCWKVVIVMPKGNNDLTRIDTSARVLVVDMPNDNRLFTTSAKDAWRNYLTTISNLEQNSASEGRSLSFLTAVGAPVRTYLKTKAFR
ncbi:MAG: sugar-non-specific nuclease NucA [Flaviaesturariibacter sp.]|nr:sugar-non-specific nuclease NucA [Flaviaesturariibacter sp.]